MITWLKFINENNIIKKCSFKETIENTNKVIITVEGVVKTINIYDLFISEPLPKEIREKYKIKNLT